MKLRLLSTALIFAASISSIQLTQAAGTVNWGYFQHGSEPIVLPASWGEHFPDCNGFSQSPVNITNTVKSELSELDISYEDTPLRIINNGHTIQVNYAPGSSLYIANKDQRVLQFHFHTPSENVINGQHYPMEMHIVHADTAGALTVVAVFIEEGKENETFAKIIANAPLHKGEFVSFDEINVDALLPEKTNNFYNFSGSLTTPPCSEGVNWLVMENSITFSAEQIAAFEHIIHENNRPVQDINDRTIFLNDH